MMCDKVKEVIKEPFLCCIWMGTFSVNFFSKEDNFMFFFQQKHNGFVPWIPGWKITKKPSESGCAITYSITKNISIECRKKGKLVVIEGPKEECDAQAIAYIAFWMLEAQRQNQGILTSHAAALARGNRGVLFLGERGYGKTSVILDLCRKYDDYLIANDLAILGYDKDTRMATVYDGTKIFGFRLAAVRENFPDLLHRFKIDNEESRTTRVFINPEELEIKVQNDTTVLRKIFMVYLDATQKDKLSVKIWDDLWIRNYLYENFSRYIRGTAIMAFGARDKNFLGYLPSLDNPKAHFKRVNFINHLIDDIQIIGVSGGNLNEIVNFIHDTINEE